MNTKRTLRIVRQIVREYDEGRLVGTMRQFVASLRSLLVSSGPDCEDLIKQSLRLLLADIDRSPLTLIPERHLVFLRGLCTRDVVGSALKRTVTDMIAEGCFTKNTVLQQFSELLADIHDLGTRLKGFEQHASLLGIHVEDIPDNRAIINATVVPGSVTSQEYANRVTSLVEIMRTLCSISGGHVFSVEMQAEDCADSVISFTVERSTATFFCVLYLGILDTYTHIRSFDTHIANLASLRTSKGVIRVLEKEKRRILNERLVVSTNIALSEFFKNTEYDQRVFQEAYSLIIDLILKIEDGFSFDIELGPQNELPGQMSANSDKLVHYLFAINKLFPCPGKGLQQLFDHSSHPHVGGGGNPVAVPRHTPQQTASGKELEAGMLSGERILDGVQADVTTMH